MISALLLWVAMGQQPDPRPACTPALTGVKMEGTVCNGELWVSPKMYRPQPPKCGEWEHVEHMVCPDRQYVGCAQTQPSRDYCAPDLHTMTEKEYRGWRRVQATRQEVNDALKQYILDNEAQLKAIMERLAKLEKKAQAGSK